MNPAWFAAILIPVSAFLTTLIMAALSHRQRPRRAERHYLLGALVAQVIMFIVVFTAMMVN
jgi:Na+/melibiose symporter-like transporter